MAITINGVQVIADVRDVGNYVYLPYAEITDNGLGQTTTAGLPSATWTFPQMEKAGFNWIVTTLMAGAGYLSVPAVLLNDLDVETSFSSVIVRRPTYSGRSNGRYLNVEWRFDTMVKA